MNSWVDSVPMDIEKKLEKILWGVVLGIHVHFSSRTLKEETWKKQNKVCIQVWCTFICNSTTHNLCSKGRYRVKKEQIHESLHRNA